MIYLIKNHQGFVKIGYTQDFESRMNSYKSHGAEITVLDSTEGNVRLERRLQAILYHKGLRLFGEWFTDSPIIYKIWEMAKNKKWKPIYYLIEDYPTPFDIFLYNEIDIRDSYEFKVDIVRPKVYRKHIYHWTQENYGVVGAMKR